MPRKLVGNLLAILPERNSSSKTGSKLATVMRMQKIQYAFFSLLLALTGAAGLAHAQSADFIVSQHGKPVGTASFRFTANGGGYDSTSLVRVAMQGLDYALSKTERLSSANHLCHVQLSGTVNGSAVSVTATQDAAQFLINTSANGKSTTMRLPLYTNAVFLADFDPGSLETLLALAVNNNNRNLWVILPKQAGSMEAVQLATYADESGTLDGQTILVHHLVATIAGATTDLFSGPENQLLQAELPQQGFALVRKGFVLAPPSKPIAPPGD
jgi:hypothetical protein